MTEGAADGALFEAAFRDAAIGMALMSLDGRWLKVNDALCRMVGYARDALLELDAQTLTHSEDLAPELAHGQTLLNGTVSSYQLEKRFIHRDGKVVWALSTVSLVRDAEGAPSFLTAQVQDISERHEAEAEARAFFEQSLDLLAIAHVDGVFMRVNPSWETTLGHSADELIRLPFLELIHPEDQVATLAAIAELQAGKEVRAFRNRYRSKDGSYHWLDWSTRPGEHGRLFCVARDVTSQVAHDQALRMRDRALAAVGNGIVITDAQSEEQSLIYVNPAFTRMTGYTAEEVLGKSCRFLQGDDRDQADLITLRKAISERKECRVVLRNYTKDGKQFLNQLSIAPVQDAAGATTQFVGVLEDITARVEMEEQVRQASLVDELTGLSNRRGFFLLGEQALRAAGRHERSQLLCFLDLDGLKEINDELGHDQGDQALVDVAELLKRVFRHSDIVARIGGDEFVALAEGDGSAEPSLRQRIGDELKRHNESAARGYFLSASLGIAYFNPRKPVTLSELLMQADRQMYERKRSSRRAPPQQTV